MYTHTVKFNRQTQSCRVQTSVAHYMQPSIAAEAIHDPGYLTDGSTRAWSAAYTTRSYNCSCMVGLYSCMPNWLTVWLSGNAFVSINEVNLRRARLVLRWVTVSGVQLPVQENLSQYIPSHPGQLSLTTPPWIGIMSTCTSQRAVMLCGWGVRYGS